MIFTEFLFIGTIAAVATEQNQSGQRQLLADDWLLKSSVLVAENGVRI